MSYTEALERLKTFQDAPGTAVPKVTKAPYGTYGTPPPGPSENFNPSGTNGGCHSKALSEPVTRGNEISESPAPGSATSDERMPSRPELAAICRRAVRDFPSVPADRLLAFLVEAEDPGWCSEKVARRLAQKMAEGLIHWRPER